MIFIPRLPPRYTCAIATNTRATAAARYAPSGAPINEAIGPANANASTPTTADTTSAITTARRTIARMRPPPD